MILTKEEIEQNERNRREYGDHWHDIDHPDGKLYFGLEQSKKPNKEMATKHDEDRWIAQQLEREKNIRANIDNHEQRGCKLMHPMHDDAARREELDLLANIGSRGAPRFAPIIAAAPSANPATYQANQVVNDMLHQLRVQMEPPFVQRFIASLTPASRDWIKANEDQAQTKVAEALKASGMSLDQLRALLDSSAEK